MSGITRAGRRDDRGAADRHGQITPQKQFGNTADVCERCRCALSRYNPYTWCSACRVKSVQFLEAEEYPRRPQVRAEVEP